MPYCLIQILYETCFCFEILLHLYQYLSYNNRFMTHVETKIFILVVVLALFISVKAGIAQLNLKNYHIKTQESQYTLVYFYSSTCNFCKQFTPIYEKLQKSGKLTPLNVSFTKIDGPAYENLTHSLQVFSYPSLLIYRKGVPLPVAYRKQRKQKELIEFVQFFALSSQQPQFKDYILNASSQLRIKQKLAIFYGKNTSLAYWRWDTIVKRDGYIHWVKVQSQQQKLIFGDHEASVEYLLDPLKLPQLQKDIARTYAKLHTISQESWLKMAQRKKFTIMYFNKHGNRKNKELLAKLAQDIYKVHFIQIDGEHEEFKNALNFLGLPNDEYLISVDKKYDAIYVAEAPYSEESLRKFIVDAEAHKLTLYRKTEKTDKVNKLTRLNYHQRMSTNQDVLLFLYDRTQKSSKDLMSLFEFMVAKLKDNKNLLLLRCDVNLNEIEQYLGFVTKPTPKVVYLRNRMKDYPIHFNYKSISPKTIIDFIMENTTFDFEDSWAQL